MNWHLSAFLRDLRESGATSGELFRIFIYTMLYALFEGVGIGLLVPVLNYVSREEGRTDPGALGSGMDLLGRLPVGKVAHPLVLLLLAAFLAVVVRTLFHYLQDAGGARLKSKIEANLRKRAVEEFALSDFTFLSLYDSGRLLSALTAESDRAGGSVAARIVFLNALTLIGVYSVLLLFLSPALFFFMWPVYLLGFLVFRHQRSTTRRLGEKVSTIFYDYGQMIRELIGGMQRVKMRGLEREVVSNIQQSVGAIARNSYFIERQRIFVEIGLYPVLVLSAFFILFIAVEFLSLGLAELGVFMFVMLRLAPYFTTANALWSQIQGGMASYRNLVDLLDFAARHREREDGRPWSGMERGIEIRGLSFRYPSSPPGDFALSDMSCTIRRGSLLAIVGRSGAGKTTLVRLLTGFYEPSEGHILVDGVPIQHFEKRSLRRHMAYVPQEPFLFNTTIRENLSYGLDNLSRERMDEVLALAHCTEFVARLDKGVETVVGEGGHRLSQGQRQRLTIAHALATGAEILFLDEPTSALDAESDKAIQQTLSKLKGSLTILIIAHRLSTIRDADQILLLDKGEMKHMSDHDSLMIASALYRRLVSMQSI